MEPTYYELDPEGDVIFLFTTSAESPSASAQETHNAATPDHNTTPTKQCNTRVGTADGAETSAASFDTEKVRMRVSSKHLVLVSPVFKKMFHGPWKESATLAAGNPVEINMDEWNQYAMLLLMQIIHGHADALPKDIDLRTMAHIAILVDYYKCDRVGQFIRRIWPKEMPMECSYYEDTPLWIWISWVFRQHDNFGLATSNAIGHATGPLSNHGMPIPQFILDKIESRRQHAIRSILEDLHTVVNTLRDANNSKWHDGTSFEYRAAMLGSLIMQLGDIDILQPPSQASIPEISFDTLISRVENAKSPNICMCQGKSSKRGAPLNILLEPVTLGGRRSWEVLYLNDLDADGHFSAYDLPPKPAS